MIKRSLLALAASLAITGTAVAGPNWLPIVIADNGSSYLDWNFGSAVGDQMTVRLMRNYTDAVDLGADATTQEPLYAHRSVKVTYRVDCAKGTIAMDGWQMYSGNYGDGELVWADRQAGTAAFLSPGSAEEKFAVVNACAARSVLSMR